MRGAARSGKAVRKRLPKDPAKLWGWLIATRAVAALLPPSTPPPDTASACGGRALYPPDRRIGTQDTRWYILVRSGTRDRREQLSKNCLGLGQLGYALLHQITRARSVHVSCDRAES
jgi:hypothetical protein